MRWDEWKRKTKRRKECNKNLVKRDRRNEKEKER